MPHPRRSLSALTLAGSLTWALGRSAAQPVPVLPPPGAVVTDCWLQARTFDTLRNGPFAYCRKNLRYRPGALECFWIAERVCWVFFPDRREWSQLHTPEAPVAFPCPDGPEPPVCPRLAGL